LRRKLKKVTLWQGRSFWAGIAFYFLLVSPIVGCNESSEDEVQAIQGSLPGSERWVVYFDSKELDLTAYRNAQAKGEDTAQIETMLRESAKERYKEFEAKLKGFEGRIVDTWFLTEAVTIEVASGALGTLRTLPGVVKIEPDRLIE
jgi:hypothetical protein